MPFIQPSGSEGKRHCGDAQSSLLFHHRRYVFFDGTSTTGCDFTLHREKGKNRDCGLSPQIRKKQYRKRRTNETAGYIRRKEADQSKMQMAVLMVRRAWKQGLRASYVLMDSWFTSSEMIRSIRSIAKGAMHVTGLVKVGNQKYPVKCFIAGKLS